MPWRMCSPRLSLPRNKTCSKEAGKMRRRKRQPAFVPGLMISPMIDLIFQLLVFFIVSTMYMTDVQTIPIQLPVAKHAAQTQKQNFAVTVKKDGSLFLNEKKIEQQQLLQTAAQAK